MQDLRERGGCAHYRGGQSGFLAGGKEPADPLTPDLMERTACIRSKFQHQAIVPIVTIMVLLLHFDSLGGEPPHCPPIPSRRRPNAGYRRCGIPELPKYPYQKPPDALSHGFSNEPRYKAAFQSGHLPTLRDQIKDLPADQQVDVAMFSATNGELLASAKRDPLIPIGEFDRSSMVSVKRALSGEETGRYPASRPPAVRRGLPASVGQFRRSHRRAHVRIGDW